MKNPKVEITDYPQLQIIEVEEIQPSRLEKLKDIINRSNPPTPSNPPTQWRWN